MVTDTAVQHNGAADAAVPGDGANGGSGAPGGEPADAAGEPVRQAVPAELGLAVIEGLADDVEIARTTAGLSIRMSWPSATAAS